MSQIVTAIYVEGMLRPLTPLELPERAQVEIELRQVAQPNDERKRVLRALAESGVIINRPFEQQPVNPISDEERERLARLFSVGKPLSEMIIEEREGR